jgi:hypothetical protein
MSLTADRTRLRAITKELTVRWEETKNYWKDAKSQEFERQYLEELLARVDKAVVAIEKLEKVAARARSDCE